jgi:DNA-directed RNA polymerase subunit RPC12/RpoP
VCPHCGYVHRDSWDMSEGVRNCNDCGREFDLTRHTEVTYTTTKA